MNNKYGDILTNYDEKPDLPRVTSVLADTQHEEYLLKWANSLGYKRMTYSVERDKASDIGSLVHKAIQDHLENKYDETYSISADLKDNVFIAFRNFRHWWEDFQLQHRVEVFKTEISFYTETYKGTCDVILNIDGKYYLGDFKTSNQLSYKNILQLAAYKFALEKILDINIEGVFIIRIDKKRVMKPEFQIYSMANNEHYDLIHNAYEVFNKSVELYSKRNKNKTEYKEVKHLNGF